MKREIYVTDDGSHTIAIPDLHVTYHSTFGAIQESRHVFIEAGLLKVMADEAAEPTEKAVEPTEEAAARNPPAIEVFEMGFGTGLNALLTLQAAIRHHRPVRYQTVDLHPLSEAEAGRLNYTTRLRDDSLGVLFPLLHSSQWNKDVAIHCLFTLNKAHASISDVVLDRPFHLIYYDAFAPDVQPELWAPDIYEKLHRSLYPGGILVTYCCKGAVKRGLQKAGFIVEKLPGPRGKREILRGMKK